MPKSRKPQTAALKKKNALIAIDTKIKTAKKKVDSTIGWHGVGGGSGDGSKQDKYYHGDVPANKKARKTLAALKKKRSAMKK